MEIIKGNLIQLALEGEFDVITHGTNCFCTQGAGIALQMNKFFNTLSFPLEKRTARNKYGKVIKEDNFGNVNKLGQIDYKDFVVYNENNSVSNPNLTVVNLYSQFEPGINTLKPDEPPINYSALELGLTKINYKFAGKRIGLPEIGCGLAGGDLDIVKQIIKETFTRCHVTLVEYDMSKLTGGYTVKMKE